MIGIVIILIIFCLIVYLFEPYPIKLHSSDTQIIYNNTQYQPECLMIVAHPDDEFIFGGDVIIKDPDWRWCVVVLTGATRSSRYISSKFIDRGKELKQSSDALKFKCIHLDFGDSSHNRNWDKSRLKSQISQIINERDWKMIVTHNKDGEYGHLQHKLTHNIVKQLTQHLSVPLSTFHYNKQYNCTQQKLKLMNTLYKSQKGVMKTHIDWITHSTIKQL